MRDKNGRFIKGNKEPCQFQKGLIPWHKGKKCPQISIRVKASKLDNSKFLKLYYKNGGKHWNTGLTKELDKRVSLMGFSKGHKGFRKIYYPLSNEIKNKISIGISGKNHPQWLGGKSFEPYGIEFNDRLREEIRKKDNYKCQLCGCSELENIRLLSIHHIDYNKQNNKEENLISLCISCHIKTNYKRKYWINYFQKKELKLIGGSNVTT